MTRHEDVKHDPHAELQRAVEVAEREVAGIETLVAEAEQLLAARRAALAAVEAELDDGALGAQFVEVVSRRAALAAEVAAVDRALAGRQARLQSAKEARTRAIRDVSRHQLAEGIMQLRAADDELMQELLSDVRKAAGKSVALAARDTELRALLEPAGYLGANSPGVPELPMTHGLVAQLGETVRATFQQQRERLLACNDNSPAASVAAKETR